MKHIKYCIILDTYVKMYAFCSGHKNSKKQDFALQKSKFKKRYEFSAVCEKHNKLGIFEGIIHHAGT